MASSGVGALEAVRVINFTQVLDDPFCTRRPKLISEGESWISGRAQCGLIGRTDLVNDAGALIALARVANRDLAGELESFTSAHTEQGLAQLSGRKTPFGPQNNVRAIMADPHFGVRNMLVAVEHRGVEEPVTATDIPLKMTGTPGRIERRAPMGAKITKRSCANLACRPSAWCDRNRKRRSTDRPPRHHEKECRCP